jgi:hypothetical protein
MLLSSLRERVVVATSIWYTKQFSSSQRTFTTPAGAGKVEERLFDAGGTRLAMMSLFDAAKLVDDEEFEEENRLETVENPASVVGVATERLAEDEDDELGAVRNCCCC